VSEETLSRTTLGRRVQERALVNLEPALKLSDRLGGHLVSGHVDGLGMVTAIESLEASWRLAVTWQDPRFGKYICDKASIAVDGISLTVASCEDGGSRFWLAVIPHTWLHTTLRLRRVGDLVNLEADLLARYLERLLVDRGAEAPSAAPEPITTPWLANHGWLAN
jgi:riboflavin synthase